MFSVAFFSLASLALSALASPLALSGLPTTPSGLEKKDHAAVNDVRDTPAQPSGISHTRRTPAASDPLTVFCGEFEGPLAKVEALVNGAPDAQTLATAMGPALCDLMTPMSKFVGQVNVWQFGASVQGTRVTVSTQQTIETVTTYATRLTTCLSKASDLVQEEFPEVGLAIETVTITFTTVVTTVGIIYGLTLSVLSPVLQILTPLVTKLGACATSSLGL